MKTILLFLILLCVIVMPAIGALEDADLDKIRLIVKDEIAASEERFDAKIQASEKRLDAKIQASEKRLDAKIQASETRMKAHITQQVDSLKTPVVWLMGILVALIALIGIPLVVLTIMMGWRSVKDNSQEKINRELREEIETLKQQRVVNP